MHNIFSNGVAALFGKTCSEIRYYNVSHAATEKTSHEINHNKLDVVGSIDLYKAPIAMYQSNYPYIFIASASLLFFFCLCLFSLYKFKAKWANYMAFYAVWFLLTCAFGGAIWSYFDMKAGYFPEGVTLFAKVWKDISYGISIGSIMILCASFPFNVLVYSFSVYLLKKEKKLSPD